MVRLFSLVLIYLSISAFFRISIRYKKISFLLNLCILTAVTGSAYELVGGGGDYDNYRYFFQNVSISSKDNYDIGFYLLNALIKIFTNNFYIAFLIFMFIINFFILQTLYKYSSNIEISLIMYVILGGYSTAANITRQYIAAAIYFFSVKYILQKQNIKYVIWSLIAISFHITVIIPILITFVIYRYTDKLKKYYFIYFCLINSLILFEPIIRKIGIELLGKGYAESKFNYGSNILHYLVQLVFIIFYYINIKRIETFRESFFVNMAMICIGFTLLSNNMVLYARIASYFNLFNLLATSNIINFSTNIKEKRMIMYFMSIGLLIYYNLLTIKGLTFNNYIIDFISNF